MLFAVNIQLSNKSTSLSLGLRFLYLHAPDIQQQTFRRTREETMHKNTDFRNRPWKTSAQLRHWSGCPIILERLKLTYADDKGNRWNLSIGFKKMFEFFFTQRNAIWKHICTLLTLRLLPKIIWHLARYSEAIVKLTNFKKQQCNMGRVKHLLQSFEYFTNFYRNVCWLDLGSSCVGVPWW